jgi:anaerobic magnesium-protoporphyrin IX monomethyl ester cyclase
VRVLLINPPLTRGERYGRFAQGGSTSPPNGLLYLAAVLERDGHQVRIIDGLNRFLTATDIVARSRDFRPDLVGLSLATIAFYRGAALARMIKEKRPDLPIVVGGPDVSARLEEYGAHLPAYPFDFAVYGEGERTIVELVRVLDKGGDLDGILGLIHAQNGAARINPPRPWLTDLDDLPLPARHLLPDLHKYRPNLMTYKRRPWTTMITSRGCPNQCTFCDRSLFGQHYRARSAAGIFDELRHLQRAYGIREVHLMDDTFTIQRGRVEELCDRLVAAKTNLTWMCFARADNLDQRLLAKMRRAGCWMISLGIESGDIGVLRVIKKRIDLDQVRRVCDWSRRLGVAVRGLFMLGLPTETKRTVRRTIDLARSLNLYTADFCITYLLPNTELTRTAAAYGQVGRDKFASMSGHTSGELTFIPRGFTQQELLDYQRRAYLSLFLRPGAALNVLRQVNTPRDLRTLLGKLPVGLTAFQGLVRSGKYFTRPQGCVSADCGPPPLT